MNPTYLELQGFRGIRAGQGTEGFHLDLAAIPGELIAITGRNGAGKTTVLDNLHPYRLMPSRVAEDGTYSPAAFSYWEHVEDRAKKVLRWDHDGQSYVSVFDWETRRGKRNQSAILTYANGTRVGESDGKVSTYDAEVERILGPASLYFTSAFAAQGRRPLAAYRAADMKGLLSSMLGLDEIEALGKRAGVVRRRLSQTVAERSRGLRSIDELAASRTALVEQKTSLEQRQLREQHNLSQTEEMLQTARGAVARIDLSEVEYLQAQEARSLDKIAKIRAEVASRETYLRRQEEAVRNRIANHEKALAGRARVEDAQAQIGSIERALGPYAETAAILDRLRREFAAARNAWASIDTRTPGERKVRLQTEVDAAERSAALVDQVPCRGMAELQETCPLLESARAGKDRLGAMQSAYENACSKYKEMNEADDQAHSEVDFLASRIAEEEENDQERQTLERKLGDARVLASQADRIIEAEKWLERDLAELDEVTKSQDGLRSVASGINDQIEIEKVSLRQIQMELEQAHEKVSSLPALQQEVRSLEASVAGLRKDIEEHIRGIAGLEEQIRRIDADIEATQIAQASLEPLQDWTAKFTLLERALGRDGIIALIIDDAGPQIAEIANSLLEECYGGRYALQIRTQRELKSGDLREGFEIQVLDGDTGGLAEIGMKSGGQRVVINEALTRAIGIYRMQSSGHGFDALFGDEEDGALDPEAKIVFTRMKRSVLRRCGARRMFFITHSESAWEEADEVIRL